MELLLGILGGALLATLLFAWAKRRKEATPDYLTNLPPPSLSVERETPPSLPPPELPEELVLGSADDPAIRLRAAALDEKFDSQKALELPTPTKRALVPLLQHAPRLFVAGAEAAGNVRHVVLTFSPETARGLATGALELTRSAQISGGLLTVVRDSGSKRLVEHGVLVSKINPVAIVTAVWQVAAIVTAQKFLADINEKLAGLQKGIDGLRSLLDDQTVGELRAHGQYLIDRVEALKFGRLSPVELQAVVTHLEGIDTDARAVAQRVLLQLRRVPAEIDAQNWSAKWSTADAANGAVKCLDGAAQEGRMFALASEVRLMVVALRGSLELDPAYASKSLDSLSDDLRSHDIVWDGIHSKVETKLPKLAATLQWKDTDKAHRQLVATAISELRAEMVDSIHNLASFAERIRGGLVPRDGETDLRLLVEVDAGGSVRRAQRLMTA